MAALSVAGVSHSKSYTFQPEKLKPFGHYHSLLLLHQNMKQLKHRSSLSVRAEYSDGSRGGGGDFVAGFLLGGALFGTLAYFFSPQIRKSLLNEDEYGFQKAKGPVYFDEGLQKTRQTLDAKISQLNSAIDNVSSQLRSGNNVPTEPAEADLEVEATIQDL